MGANVFDPATNGLTTKAQCQEKISKLKIEIAELKEKLVRPGFFETKDSIKSQIASRKTDIEKIKAHMAKCK